MTQPLFWLGLSLFLVAICLTAMIMAAYPAFQELARAARSAEKLFDTLNRELPPTLDAIRSTGSQINDLKEDISGGVVHASQVIEQVDHSLTQVRYQVYQSHVTTRSLWAGARAAWRSLLKPSSSKRNSGKKASHPQTGSLPKSENLKQSRR